MTFPTKYKLPPRTGMEVFNMLPFGTLAEVINNVVYIFSPPSIEHQHVSGILSRQIYLHMENHEAGECLARPIDVFLDERNAVQPDILATVGRKFNLTGNDTIKGTPDFIIEILSPGNKRHDTEKKKTLYEKFGVREYFIIDPDNKDVTTYYLANAKFVKQLSVKGKIKSKLLKKVFTF